MTDKRVPLSQESIADADAVQQYDSSARYIMLPQYKYFAWKLRREDIRGGRVLDIGTGSGRLAIQLAKIKGNRFNIFGIDISENMITKAEENARQNKTDAKTKFIVASASALPFPDESFDLVISYASLHHWRDPAAVFNEARRVVKETGRIIIRDNKRLYNHPFWRTVIWILCRFVNRRHRENWPTAIMACYTIPEIKEILRRSNLKNYSVSKDFIGFDMCIESSKQ